MVQGARPGPQVLRQEVEDTIRTMRALAELLQALLQLCQRPVRLRVQVQASRQGRAQQCASGAHDRLQQHAVLALIEIIAARQLQLWIIRSVRCPENTPRQVASINGANTSSMTGVSLSAGAGPPAGRRPSIQG